MPLLISVITTANRQQHFGQDQPKMVLADLRNLPHASQIFRKPTLVIAGEQTTVIYNPATITRIEFETEMDLSRYVPTAWGRSGLQICSGPPPDMGEAGARETARLVDFYFVGGDLLTAWLQSAEMGESSASPSRLASLFEQSVIPYRLPGAGIGLINPANLTRTRLGAPLRNPPAGTLYANEAVF